MEKHWNRHRHVRATLFMAAVALAFLPLACSRGANPPSGRATSTPSVTATPTLAATPTPTATSPTASRTAGTVTTCDQYRNVTVGSYVVETNFFNQPACPGTQCLAINTATGAFTVTQCPDCGSTVASFPNVLYGCSWGFCSPGSALPKQVGALTTVTSSWSFSVGGTPGDQYNVAYDLWFCPNKTCGSSGFPNGGELMIWLDYQNVGGWLNDQGPVSLAGHSWEVWQATQTVSGSSWTYLAYLIQAPMVTSVTDLDLMAFIQDARVRGYVQDSWYLYAIQAGIELRTGGLPYDHNSFSVSIT